MCIRMDQDIEMKEDEDTFSNSAEESSSEDEVDNEKIAELKDNVEREPYCYEYHIQLISFCRKVGDLEELRSAREKMSKVFPLTPELWLDWLADEKNLATTKEQKDALTALFERAIKDYTSVSIWLEYVQFSIGKIGDSFDENGLAAIRETFERAITAVGIHVTQGCLIWEAYREFETIYKMHLKVKYASETCRRLPSQDKTQIEAMEQERRVYNIFKRQLSIPLFDMDKTYAEFKELYQDDSYSDRNSIEYSYKKALQKLNQIQAYENALYESESPHYEEYKSYIQYEKKNGDPCRVQNLYERALIENCLREELWIDYVKYMDRTVKICDMSLPVHERSVRNLHWSAQLWVLYGRALELYESPHEKIIETFEAAVMVGYLEPDRFKELWLGYLDYLRRRIKIEDLENGVCEFKEIEEVFNRAIILGAQYFPGHEEVYAIMKYWIFFNAKYKKDIVTARETWRELIKHKEEARIWLDYANFEKQYGDASHYRKVLLQALSRVSDWPETFFELLITFEREEGTLESLDLSLAKSEVLLQQVKEKRMKKFEEAASNSEKQNKRKSSSRRQTQNSSQDSPTKAESDLPVKMDSEGFKIPPPPMKLHSPESNARPESSTRLESNTRSENQADSESNKKKRSSSDDDYPEPKKIKVESSESHGKTIEHDPSKDDRTVFASNLSYKVEEDKLKEFFSRMGEVEEVRLVKDFKGRSKGFCYILFKSQSEAKNALSKDREPLDGRPVFISSCEDKKNNSSLQPKFKFGTGLERKKLFIKNLPFSTTKEELETIYKEYGTLKDVRIVTYRNGHSKGLAYVEFTDEAAASNAVVKTDGLQIGEHVISVAISNPPPRKQGREFSSVSISESLGGGGGRPKGPRGRGRTQLSLLPRSVCRPPQNKKSSSHSNNSLQNGQNSSSTVVESKPLSNSDFAKMLQK